MERDPVGPGQESVWDYPLPPHLERTDAVVVVRLGDGELARSHRALRTLETSHPPVYYLPFADVEMTRLTQGDEVTWCEYKGAAHYWEAEGVPSIGWSYPSPSPGFEALAGHIAFYPGRVSEATIDGEVVRAQDGDFYGGWITSRIVGPFKGALGTSYW